MERQNYLWIGFKNVLVQYQGGGYSGCFWEWNAAYFDENGVFHSLWASGSLGCETIDDLADIERRGYCMDVFCIDLDDQVSVDTFAKETNAQFVNACAITIAKQFQIGMEAPCPICGLRVDLSEDMELINDQGEGGLAHSHHDWICHDCHSNGSCSYCGEYYGQDYKEWVEDDHYGQLCPSCAESIKEEKERRKVEQDLADWNKMVNDFNNTEFKDGCPIEKDGE